MAMKYKCILDIVISAAGGTARGLCAVSLDFAPFAGLALRGIGDAPQDRPIVRVSFDVTHEVFYCFYDIDQAEDDSATLAEVQARYGSDWSWIQLLEKVDAPLDPGARP